MARCRMALPKPRRAAALAGTTIALASSKTTIGVSEVPLLHLYSNTPGLLTDLEAVRWTLGRRDLEDERELPSTKQPWRLRDRLSESDLDAIVLRFKHGEPMSSLAREYGITDWSVRNLIKRRGHRLGLDVPPPGAGKPDEPAGGR